MIYLSIRYAIFTSILLIYVGLPASGIYLARNQRTGVVLRYFQVVLLVLSCFLLWFRMVIEGSALSSILADRMIVTYEIQLSLSYQEILGGLFCKY